MFGMGRDDLIPRRFFAHLHPVRNTPNYNIWLIGLLAYGGSLVMSHEATLPRSLTSEHFRIRG